jgi:hypothetical protein
VYGGRVSRFRRLEAGAIKTGTGTGSALGNFHETRETFLNNVWLHFNLFIRCPLIDVLDPPVADGVTQGSWYIIPKRVKYIPNYQKVYQMAVK